MSSRPTNIQVPFFNVPNDGPASPRTGELAPALSPLDALVLQSRLLAKKFDESSQGGNRISRLPAHTVENEFKSRPAFMRSMSDGAALYGGDHEQPQNTPSKSQEQDESRDDHPSPLMGRKRSVKNDPTYRPTSHYPQIQYDGQAQTEAGASRSARLSGPARPPFNPSLRHVVEGQTPSEPRPSESYFDIPRASSPENVPTLAITRDGLGFGSHMSTASQQSVSGALQSQNDVFVDRSPSQTYPGAGLMPPKPLPSQELWKSSPSGRSTADDGSDTEGLSAIDSMDSLPPRKNSFSGSIPRSYSPLPPTIPRPPSTASNASFGAQSLRPSFNFSRPLSNVAVRPSTETKRSCDPPGRQNTNDSSTSFEPPSRQDSQDMPDTPSSEINPPTVTIVNDELPPEFDSNNSPGPSSYVHTKFTLPRGRFSKRESKRESIGLEEFLNRQFQWDDIGSDRPAADTPTSLHFPGRTSTESDSRSIASAPANSQSRKANTSRSPPRTGMPGAPSIASSNSTIKPPKAKTPTLPPNPSGSEPNDPESHLQLGIECHERGQLQESTYHLRLAARAGHPTAMLLYALACRHGWGMRPNAAEGVSWLQKAVDSAQLEVADDEDLVKKAGPSAIDRMDQKTHKAQFALSVYELGVSYLNGWGVQQDKALALRCFEVAGNWGDPDALSEAGFCYAEGIGCKRDGKKAAWFYRRAAKKGVSMAGNSWIYKDKYMSDDESQPDQSREQGRGRGRNRANTLKKGATTPEKKPRDKSRTRTIFGRKKSVVQN